MSLTLSFADTIRPLGRQGFTTAAHRRAAAAAAAAAPSPPPDRHRSSNQGAVRASGLASAVSREAEEEARQDAVLRRWIQDNGGFVHDSISITRATQCGARGLVATESISLQDLECGWGDTSGAGCSLVVVPRSLHMDGAAAVTAVGPHLGSAARQEAFREGLGQVQQVGCCLAIERAKGSESFWLPYVSALPYQPPNPWLLTGGSLAEALELAVGEEESRNLAVAEAAEAAAVAAAVAADEAAVALADAADAGAADELQAAADEAGWMAELAASEAHMSRSGVGPRHAGWAAAVEAARRRYGRMAEDVLDVVGEADSARLGLDLDGLLWAFGQVVSRSLGSGRSSGLIPFIDMANHHVSGRPPMMMLDERDRVVFTLTNIREGELAPLEAGQELFINYQPEGMSPLQAWLKWGFVPQGLVVHGAGAGRGTGSGPHTGHTSRRTGR